LETNLRVRERFGRRWRLPELDAAASRLQRLAWEVGLFTCALRGGVEAHADWLSVSHEHLCADPIARFRSLFEQVGYPWSPAVEDYLRESDRPGEGWSTHRVAADQPDRWRRRLDAGQIREAWSILSRFEAPWVDAVAADLA
jgi:hypothetical protein